MIIPAAWNGRNLEAWDLVMRFVLDDNFFRMSDIKVLECTLMIGRLLTRVGSRNPNPKYENGF